ncbi:MAG TPA: energy transducer TonB [Paraburkholderia sp.]|jgi:protein TonB|nr:energy transducer TonB [Paraburkholderia sp.]
MGLATTFHFDSAARGERVTSRLEFAVALAVVIALHAALGVWILRSRALSVPPPLPPQTIVARLLSVAPAPTPAPAPQAVEPPRASPAHANEPPRPAPLPRAKPPAAPRKVHRETPAATTRELPTPVPVPTPATPSTAPSPAQAASATPPAPSDTAQAPTQHAAPAQPLAANAPPKTVSHVDCNIAQPDYPEVSQRRNEIGTAVIRFVVGVDGRVESASVQQSSGYARLDDAALGAVRGGTCRPWKDGGVAVRVAYTQPFVFGLRN